MGLCCREIVGFYLILLIIKKLFMVLQLLANVILFCEDIEELHVKDVGSELHEVQVDHALHQVTHSLHSHTHHLILLQLSLIHIF